MSNDVVEEERYRPSAGGADQVQLQKVLVQWNPEGPLVNIEEFQNSCGWYGEIGTWLEVLDLDKHRPYIWYSAAVMSCRPLEEFDSGWHLECWQRHVAPIIGHYTHYVDFYVHKEADDLGHKGWIFWTLDGEDLEWWCTYSIKVTDERPTYGWR